MVSTRQMSIVNNGECSGSSGGASNQIGEQSGAPCRATRNASSALVTAAAASSEQGPSSSSSSRFLPQRQTIFLLDLPVEVVEKILSYMTFKNVCQLRLVCRTMDRICGQILNSKFQQLQTQMLNRFLAIKRKMPRRESARRTHHLAVESDIIETLHMRLTLLQMSFGKHIERKHCCFFPGEILDEVYHILHYIRVTPKLAKPYQVTDEFFDLSTMAMEYFKEKIEPDLPEIAYFGTDFLDFTGSFTASGTSKYLEIDSSPLGPEETKESDRPSNGGIDSEDLSEVTPQSNMVLRKRIKKIKQGMKRYNSQLSILRQDLRACKRKTAEQQKQICEQQKQLAEQQKQTLEYATRLDEYDKKNEEISRKFSTLLQELNKCKTELQYWRSKSPATPPFCTGCGSVITPHPEELQALVNQGVMPEGLDLEPISDLVPTASTSTHVEKEIETNPEKSTTETVQIAPEEPSTTTTIETTTTTTTTTTTIAAVASTSTVGRNKRRSQDEMVSTTPSNKKPRRMSKMRGRRVRV